MRDGPVRTAVKALVRWSYLADLRLRRTLRRGDARWRLVGSCEGCARCCEEPTIRVPRALGAMPIVRAAFLWWQRVVNGFEMVSFERRPWSFSFRCTHFDEVTRTCDSYHSRPGMCRDYPRLLLDQPWPELFEACGYRAEPTNAPRLAEALAAVDGLDADARRQVEERLGLR